MSKVDSKKLKSILGSYGIIFVLILLVAVFASLSPRFLLPDNIFNILRQVSIVGIISVGMTFVMLTGGIDLSCGSVVGASCVGAALLMTKAGMHPVLACLVMVAFGTLLDWPTPFSSLSSRCPPSSPPWA
jgi:ribose/xylose/arabinose/galactoside ABC-type transport system permease subunit